MVRQVMILVVFVCIMVFSFGCATQVAPEQSAHPQVVNELPASPVEVAKLPAVVVNETPAKPIAPKCGDGVCNGAENCDRCYDDCACKSPAECYQGRCKIPECGGDGDCKDKDPCTKDTCEFAQHPNAYCLHDVIKVFKNNDGCCPLRGDANTDTDCESICGNHVCELGEGSDSCEKDCKVDNETD